MTVHTYLFFDGRCDEAVRVYVEVLGAELEFLMRFKDVPSELAVRGDGEKVFHATMKFGETRLNMCDVPESEYKKFAGFALLTHFDEPDEAERVFQALAVEGKIRMPLQETMWADRYGIVLDRFGITWKIQVDR